ncbi:MAG TPA: hypothetical protein VFO19_08440 [Vicinamibacterales bacterium]|nr:hypothetical protein [Vicinamibacterales bacterium]
MTALGMTTEPRRGADPILIGRLIDAFLNAEARMTYGDHLMWTGIRRMQQAAVTVLQSRDVGAVSRLLARPHEGYLFYGFEDLGVWSVEAYKDPGRRSAYAAHCHGLVQRLAQAVGVLPIHNPEPGNHVVPSPPIPALLDRIATATGFALDPPAPYPSYYGLDTPIGIVGERVLNAIYDAHRILQLIASRRAPRVLEIGAGLGRTAAYCYRAGITDYWIVDLPMTHLAQGHFLGHAIGADRLVLDGESGWNSRPDVIKLLSPERFLSESLPPFDLIVNVDSLTELGRAVGERYVKRAAELAPTFLSVNHEANEFRVFEVNASLRAYQAVERKPYWMRAGYVEEVYRQRSTS